MKYASVCSGIEAATMAWHPLGWSPVAFSEVDAFPCAVLAHHYPMVPNWGDMTKFQEWPDADVDVLVGGTPCQSFSVAGLRKGLADPRGNLMLTYLAIADRYRPEWLVWENVPGVLSSNKGRDFGTFLGGLAELGYGFAYRVLDAQYVRVESHARAVPQRRRRVFVVGNSRSWRRAAAVLFERESLCGHPAPRRETGKGTSTTTSPRAATSSGHGWWDESDVGATIRAQDSVTKADTLLALPERERALTTSNQRIDAETETLIAFQTRGTNLDVGDVAGTMGSNADRASGGAPMVAHSLRADGFDASEDGTGRGTPLAPVAYSLRSDAGRAGEAITPSADAEGRVRLRDPGFNVYREVAPTIDAGQPHAVAFDARQSDVLQYGDKAGPLDTDGHTMAVMTLAIRGRGDSHDLETRSDGTANAVLTPSGGRAGIGVGAVAFDTTQITSKANYSNPQPGDPCHPLAAGAHAPALITAMQVRRLTPRECERLQGFPDDYTLIPYRGRPAADGPRYKALGNSMAVNCMRWIGERIAGVDAITETTEVAA